MVADLRMALKGVTDSRWPGKVVHYRGIQYAVIKQRFAKPLLNRDWLEEKKEFVKFGHHCPQPPCDLQTFLQIPLGLPTNVSDFEREDELLCANLNVTCPSDPALQGLPVLIWIYGGSQVNTFGSAIQKIGDAGPLVAQSIEQQKPIILVTFHYRLNFFAFGGGEGEENLDLQDQRVAIRWVKENIVRFGGNPDNITLGGQSAGGIYVHALLASGSAALVQRAIIASGNLYTTPPQPPENCSKLRYVAEEHLAQMMKTDNDIQSTDIVMSSLVSAPANKIIQTIRDLHIDSMWLLLEANLAAWRNDSRVFGTLKGLLLGDCEFEASEDEEGVSKLSAIDIATAFLRKEDAAGEKLAKAYGIDILDDEDSRTGALHFLNDAYYAYPTHLIAKNLKNTAVEVYRYCFDQVNPFEAPQTARAHHGVELFAIFGGYDGFVNEEMKAVGYDLRTRWINFLNGHKPWKEDCIYSFGPHGQGTELTVEEAASRRRFKHFETLKEAGPDIDHEIRLNFKIAIEAAVSKHQLYHN